MSPSIRSFGAAVRTRRRALDITQAQLAMLAGLGRERVNRLERGLQPRPEEMVRLAKTLNVSLQQLLETPVAARAVVAEPVAELVAS